MAGHSATGVARRLAARLRAEPLPVPMPPPTRSGQSISRRASWGQRVDGPSSPAAPPAIPHVPRCLSPDTSPPTIEPEVRERSLTSLPVIGSIIASLVIMATIAGIRLYGSQGLSWATVTQAIQDWKAKPEVAEEELPYVTSMPLVPRSGGVESPHTEDQPAPATAKQIVLDNALQNDRAKGPNGKNNERR